MDKNHIFLRTFKYIYHIFLRTFAENAHLWLLTIPRVGNIYLCQEKRTLLFVI